MKACIRATVLPLTVHLGVTTITITETIPQPTGSAPWRHPGFFRKCFWFGLIGLITFAVGLTFLTGADGALSSLATAEEYAAFLRWKRDRGANTLGSKVGDPSQQAEIKQALKAFVDTIQDPYINKHVYYPDASLQMQQCTCRLSMRRLTELCTHQGWYAPSSSSVPSRSTASRSAI